MTLDEYQRIARDTACYPQSPRVGDVPVYLPLGLAGEAGEVAGKFSKHLRDTPGWWTKEFADSIVMELGDVLWFVSALANEMGSSLEEVASKNLSKLADRKIRGVINGSGDSR